MLKPMVAIFLTGIDFHAFLNETAGIATMRPQPRYLVDARVVSLVKLHVYRPFPLHAGLIVIAGPHRISRIPMSPRNEYTSLIFKQIK